ncbi:11846_t:CDS:2 [Funneliformis geosporum]|uniref:9979_t:CDS:1 n=1 Tax=Funneliformis geosporum TaxID=1117311 RepID=A0A9W4SW28_9GLOM|nr:11846_t:CDS:2 [Funneliformis geosporum]CAI2183001.1 9979_t:CDS:2 [Funneliformis geosporum]
MSESAPTSSSEHETSPSVRRKKATRACFHCQKAHLTCDDSRPCQRCIKRDLAATCTDGIRKKAKYLQDSNYEGNNLVDSSIFGPGGYPLATANYGFGSEAVNLEYSILSNMLSTASSESIGTHPGPIMATTPTNNINGVGNSTIGTSHKRENSGKRKSQTNTPENVYANVKKPFSYTEGFHSLVKYVRERMDKDHIERIVRALATFRPSFIALIMNLTEEDLIFMEKCFQRTILEFEKLISFSGTPTVVWRRTGEIALVGKEFSLLTQWTKDQLLGKTTYIYEVMDNQSAVEYWEKFASHAFDNSRQSVMTTCILMRPTGMPVPCTFCFTIKRDIFDIPLAIVGNFLPILS